MEDNNTDIKDLLTEEDIEIKNMEILVNKALEDENFLSTKLHEVENDDGATVGQKISDKVADFGGSWTFIVGRLDLLTLIHLFFSICFYLV